MMTWRSIFSRIRSSTDISAEIEILCLLQLSMVYICFFFDKTKLIKFINQDTATPRNVKTVNWRRSITEVIYQENNWISDKICIFDNDNSNFVICIAFSFLVDRMAPQVDIIKAKSVSTLKTLLIKLNDNMKNLLK